MVLELDKWVISFIVFGVFITGTLLVIGDLQTNYNPAMNDSEFSDTYETIDDTYEISQEISNRTLGSDVEDEGVLESIVKGAFLAVKQIKNTFTIFINVLGDLADSLQLPSFLVNAAIGVMILAVIFALIYLFMRINI